MHSDQALSAHFFLSEFTHSQTAVRRGLRNDPLTAQLDNLRRLAAVLEGVRTALGNVSILISSGFRSSALNNAVGGSVKPPSAHMDGRAADFTAPAFGAPRDICQRLVDAGLVFDQLIHEGAWVHLAISGANTAPRNQLLTARFSGTGAPRYTPGLA